MRSKPQCLRVYARARAPAQTHKRGEPRATVHCLCVCACARACARALFPHVFARARSRACCVPIARARARIAALYIQDCTLCVRGSAAASGECIERGGSLPTAPSSGAGVSHGAGQSRPHGSHGAEQSRRRGSRRTLGSRWQGYCSMLPNERHSVLRFVRDMSTSVSSCATTKM